MISSSAYNIVASYDDTLLQEVQERGLSVEEVSLAIQRKPRAHARSFTIPNPPPDTTRERDFISAVTLRYNSVAVIAENSSFVVTKGGSTRESTIPFNWYRLLSALVTLTPLGTVQARLRTAWIITLCKFIITGKYTPPKFASKVENTISKSFDIFVKGVLSLGDIQKPRIEDNKTVIYP